MASSSRQNERCAYCQSETTEFMNGWPLRDGGFAQLCEICGSCYEEGTFCVDFHSSSDGWRDCLICGMTVHCGCIMSRHMYETLDFGGVSCIWCAEESAIVEANQYSILAEGSADSGKMKSGIGESPDSCINHPLSNETTHEPISDGSSSRVNSPLVRFGEQTKSSPNGAGIAPGPSVGKRTALQSVLYAAPPRVQSSAAHLGEQSQNSQIGAGTPVLGTQTSCQNIVAGLLSQVQSPVAQTGEEDKSSLNGEQIPADRFFGNQTSQGNTSGNVTSPPNSLPAVTDNVLPRSSEDSNSVLDLLFEKFLSVVDIRSKTTHLVLPTVCAEVFFPPIVEGQRLPLRFQDISGTDWTFTFCIQRSNNSKKYVLQRVRRYKEAMNWKYGDRVAFYRRGSDGKFVIETKKVSSDSNAP